MAEFSKQQTELVVQLCLPKFKIQAEVEEVRGGKVKTSALTVWEKNCNSQQGSIPPHLQMPWGNNTVRVHCVWNVRRLFLDGFSKAGLTLYYICVLLKVRSNVISKAGCCLQPSCHFQPVYPVLSG